MKRSRLLRKTRRTKTVFVTVVEGKNRLVVEKVLPEYIVKLNGKRIGVYGAFPKSKVLKFIRKVK